MQERSNVRLLRLLWPQPRDSDVMNMRLTHKLPRSQGRRVPTCRCALHSTRECPPSGRSWKRRAKCRKWYCAKNSTTARSPTKGVSRRPKDSAQHAQRGQHLWTGLMAP